MKLWRLAAVIILIWLATVASYTGFNSALALAGGSLAASAVMNALGGTIRASEPLIQRRKRQRANILVGLLGGFAVTFIAAPLWIAYQIFGTTGTIIIVVYDCMLLVVTYAGEKLGISKKMQLPEYIIAGLITAIVAFRLWYHSDIHWSPILIILVVLITLGYVLFNHAVRMSKGSVTTQVLINWFGALILSLAAVAVRLVSFTLNVPCTFSCSLTNFDLRTIIGIVIGGISIYGIVKSLAGMYKFLDLRSLPQVKSDLSWLTMPLVYEGLIVFGSPALSALFGRTVSWIDILTSGAILLLISIKVGYHLLHRGLQ